LALLTQSHYFDKYFYCFNIIFRMRSVGGDGWMNHRHVCVQLSHVLLQDAKRRVLYLKFEWGDSGSICSILRILFGFFPFSPFFFLWSFRIAAADLTNFRLRHRRRDCHCMGYSGGCEHFFVSNCLGTIVHFCTVHVIFT